MRSARIRSRRICSRCCSSLLPNLVLVGAILFTIAALTRQVIPVYLGAIAIFIGYLVAANYWSGITNPMLSALADPLGINALKGMTEYWTASERNTRLIGFPSMLLWNRLLWLAIAAALFAVLQRTFRFTQRDERGRGSEPVDAPGEGRRRERAHPEPCRSSAAYSVRARACVKRWP